MPSRIARRDYWALGIALLVGLANGLLFVYIIPPWQHYDEPNHFEYVWLIANRWELPRPDEYDQDMRRATAASMIDHNFFRGMNFLPELNSNDQPIWIGAYSQLSDPPLYYLLGSIPLISFTLQDVTMQLYAVRLVSLGLYLATICCIWGAMTEITPRAHLIRLLVPLTLALLPGFTELMTAINNVVGAVALFSLCLWGCLRMVMRGLSPFSFIWAGITSLLCLFTSATVYIAPLVFIISLLFAICREKWRWIAWGFLGVFTLATLFMIFTWGDPAHWYRSSTQSIPIRQRTPDAILGDYIFQLDSKGIVSPDWSVPLFQQLGTGLAPSKYTLGVWMWANKSIEAELPIVGNGTSTSTSKIHLGTHPAFFAYQVDIKTEPIRVWVSLDPQIAKNQDVRVYYDGLVLAEGSRPLDQAPTYNDPDGSSGVWGSMPFINILQNASAEQPGPRIHPWIDSLASKFLPDNTLPSVILAYLLDWKRVAWHYRMVGAMLFETFWARFGWGHVPLIGHRPYFILGIFSLFAILGTGIWFVLRLRRWKGYPLSKFLPWEACFLLLFVFVSVWISALVRGVNYLPLVKLYIPVARYAYPAILPTVLVISLGWWTLLRGLSGLFSRWVWRIDFLAVLVYAALFLVLDVYSIISILRYYSGA